MEINLENKQDLGAISSHSDGHVFSPHQAPHRMLKMIHGLHIEIH